MAQETTDPESLQLMIDLQLSDIQTRLKGKHKEGDNAKDAELAVEAYKLELETLAQFNVDKALSRSMARAVALDGDVIASHCQMEEQANQDRKQATSQDPSASAGNSAAPDESDKDGMDDELLHKLQHLYMGDNGLSSNVEAESSTWAAARAEKENVKDFNRTCIACGDTTPFFDVARCPCSHEYCRQCLTDLFTASITDESLFPPRCCQKSIPLEFNQFFLPSSLVASFREKEIEYTTTDRTYCHQPTCSTFIAANNIRGDTAVCPKCSSSTCAVCKGEAHDFDCPRDTATQEILRIAAQNGWQRCNTCHRLVELDTGCNHMSKLSLYSSQQVSNITNKNKRVAVGPSFATSAGHLGKNVLASAGTRPVSP